jgi:NAD(P)-dependent dehydrogenase (short-subunit alcohol dehydrogenase family)
VSGNYVIAGGTKGIGLGLVNRLRAVADRIDVFSRELDELQTDATVHHHRCDFTSDEIDPGMLPDVIHGATYCPGSINLRSFRSLKLSDFRDDLEVNLLGAVRFLQACQTGLMKNDPSMPGSVVLFSTVAVSQGMPMHASVAAAKGGVEGLARSLAAEWAPKVRVNCIAPALTDTPLAAKFFANDASRQAMQSKYPLGRTGTIDDLSAIAEFLMLSASGWITGQTFGVDGGMATLRK